MHGLHFLDGSENLAAALQSSYNLWLVLLSVLVASAAAFAAFYLTAKVRTPRLRRQNIPWFLTGALVLSLGIWSMHFIGMLAFQLGIPVTYEPWTTLASSLPALLASFVVLQTAAYGKTPLRRELRNAVLMGSGIGAMHYIGMDAMRMDAMMMYDPVRFALSIAVAVGFSGLALRLKQRSLGSFAGTDPSLVQMGIAALIMGSAISAMHYTGMWATFYFPIPHVDVSDDLFSNTLLAWGIGGATLIAIGTMLAVLRISYVEELTQRVSASESELRAILDSTDEGILLVTEAGRVRSMNRAATAMFAADKPDPTETGLREILPELDLGQDRTNTLDSSLRQRGTRTELVAHALDGTRFPAEATVTALAGMAEGDVSRVVVVSDLSARKQAEREKDELEARLYQSQKMEALGTLAGGIAHDFNNILSIILGNSELLRMRTSHDAVASEQLDMIETSASRAASLVAQILTFSRMNAHQMHTLDFGAVLEESLGMLREITPPGIDIIGAPRGGPWFVSGDATQIQQVIINLCTNAFHAMPGGGQLRLEVATEVREGGTDGETSSLLELRVRDTGCGIPEEAIARIFDPFFTTKDVGEGTGLGLSVVHGIVSAHNGSIEVASTVGEGTTFTVHLPLQAPQSPDRGDRAAQEVHDASGSILLTDDEPELLRLYATYLRKLGYAVETAEHGADALARLRAPGARFDLLITDLAMPELSGRALCEAAAQEAPDMPIIVMSGFGEMLPAAEAIDLGVRGHLFKPVELSRLRQVVAECLSVA